jgi:hypothetical protein
VYQREFLAVLEGQQAVGKADDCVVGNFDRAEQVGIDFHGDSLRAGGLAFGCCGLRRILTDR